MGKKGAGRGTSTQSAYSVGRSGAPSSGNSTMGQISEDLNQYQRNVGILEKIVQQLGIGRKQGAGAATLKEFQLQYDVQVDVVTQLEGRVKHQLTSGQSSAPQIVKLKRDFERVQARVQSLKLDVERMERMAKSSAGGAASGGYNANNNASSSSAHNQNSASSQQQMQLQMQQDGLSEEIMREREEEIRNINRGMHQVNEIYKDLAHIVGSQQEHVDTIETQMEESRANAEQGLKQVEKANEKYGNAQCTIS